MKEIVKARLTAAEKRNVADEIDGEIQRRSGESGRDEIAARKAAAELNVLLSQRMAETGLDALYLTDEEQATMLPAIMLDLRLRSPRRARAIAHELAHVLQRDWVAPALYGVDQVICTDQDNRAARHQIASDVDQRWGDEAVSSSAGGALPAAMPDEVRQAFEASWKMHLGTTKRIY